MKSKSLNQGSVLPKYANPFYLKNDQRLIKRRSIRTPWQNAVKNEIG